MNTIIAYLMALVFQLIAQGLPHTMAKTSNSTILKKENEMIIETCINFTGNEEKIDDNC